MGLHSRLERLGKAKMRGQEMGSYIVDQANLVPNKMTAAILRKPGQDVKDCGTYMVFRHYLASDKVRLASLHTCKKHLLCPVCAILRAGKSLRRYVDSVKAQIEAGAVPYMVTHTVKNSEDLRPRADHLLRSYRKMLAFRQQYRSKGRGDGYQLSGVEGGIYSMEVKRGAAGGWHPHIHALWLLPAGQRLDVGALRELWLKVTKDSHVFNVKPIQDEGDGIVSACLEVLKYALKFSDLTLEDNWFAARELRRLRLTASFGSLRGIKEAEAGPDEITVDLEDEPYIEYVARWIGFRYLLDSPPALASAPCK
jgi:hypothetical protein